MKEDMLDLVDAKILEALQRDGRLTSQELGERIGLSPSQCARRRQRLEDEGYIAGYRAVVDRRRVGAGVTAFIQVMMTKHSAASADNFMRLVEATPEVRDAWTLTGEADYLLQVSAPDLGALHTLIRDVLLRHPFVARVQSQIVLADLKSTGFVPVNVGEESPRSAPLRPGPASRARRPT